MIACRTGASPRIFPPVTPDLYTALHDDPATPDQQAARRVLDLADRPFTWKQRYFRWGLDAGGRVGQLLLLHRLALSAELAARSRRADFFWRAAVAELGRLAGQEAVWREVARSVLPGTADAVLSDPDELRRRLVREIFIDTHIGFFNGRVKLLDKLSPDDRASAHLAYIQEIVACARLDPGEANAVASTVAEARVELHEEAKHWAPALEEVTGLLARHPDNFDYQAKLAGLHFSKAVGELGDDPSEQAQLRDANLLLHAINRLEEIRKQYPSNSAIFEYLARLHHLRAVKLSNGDHLSQGLLEIERALALDPSLEEAKKTREQIKELMKKLKAKLDEVERQMRRSLFPTLTEQGRLLQEEVRKGSKEADAYAASAQAKETAEAYSEAWVRTLWRQVGLAEPTEHWTERAVALVKAMGVVIDHPPADVEQLPVFWQAVAAELDLEDLDAAPICRFLSQRLFKAAEGEKAPEAPGPVLVPRSDKCRGGTEPLVYWLFSRQDVAVKVAAAAVFAWLTWAAGSTIAKEGNRARRDQAYAQLVQAANRGDDATVVAAAGEFLALVPARDGDRRAGQVRELERQARHEARHRPDREAAYRQVCQAIREHDDRQFLRAAEAFLAATPLSNPDPREAEVHRLRRKVCDDPWHKRQTRDRSYQALARAVDRGDDPAVLAAAAAFLAALPAGGADPRAEQVERLVRELRDDPTAQRRRRNASYARLVAAFAKGDDPAVIAAADAFLADLPPRAEDDRAGQVRLLRRRVHDDPSARRRTRDQAYAHLAGAVPRGDDAGVLGAAEQFLDSLPVRGKDAREGQVRRLYRRAFVRWFTARDGALDSDALGHVQRYKAFTSKPGSGE